MPPQIQHKRGTSSDIASVNPILLDGEIVFETDTKKFKFGDGSTSWNNLPYAVLPNSGVSISGINIISGSGNFNTLTVSSVPVSVSGHSHTSSNITNFNTAVSGLVSGIYQPLLTNPVTGVGTSGYLSRFSSLSGLTSSIIFESGNRIGVTNTNPESILHIKDSTASDTWLIVENTNTANSTNVGIMLKDTYGASAPSSGLIYNDWPGAGMVFVASRDLADNQGGFVFRGANGTDRMVIRTNTNGNVGIGTSAPAYKLDVAGNVRTSGNHFITNNLGVGTVLPSGQLHVIGTGIISSRLGVNTSSPTTPLHIIGTGLIASTTGLPANALLDVYSTTSGEMVFNVEGTNGSLFSVIDNLSGSLMSVNNNAGLPIFEVFSDDSIIAGRFNQNDFVIGSGGNIGIGKATPSVKLDIVGGVAVSGAFAATTKSFKIDHPSKPNYTLEYGSLESPYHGVRLTGRGVVSKGKGIVELPDYLKDLIHNDDSINIQLTNLYHDKILYVSSIDLLNNKFEVSAKRAKTLSDLQFCWTLTGIRKDVEHLQVERNK